MSKCYGCVERDKEISRSTANFKLATDKLKAEVGEQGVRATSAEGRAERAEARVEKLEKELKEFCYLEKVMKDRYGTLSFDLTMFSYNARKARKLLDPKEAKEALKG